jgi:hypothetical protein
MEYKVMIKDRDKWIQWESSYIRDTPTDFDRNLDIMDELYKHAQALGVLEEQTTLEGLDHIFRIARIVNV